jgi:hypothetical protein
MLCVSSVDAPFVPSNLSQPCEPRLIMGGRRAAAAFTLAIGIGNLVPPGACTARGMLSQIHPARTSFPIGKRSSLLFAACVPDDARCAALPRTRGRDSSVPAKREGDGVNTVRLCCCLPSGSGLWH